MSIEGRTLHFWGCCADVHIDVGEAPAILRALPDGIGRKKMCDAFRELEHLPEYPRCLHRAD
ncbi:MAG TPA: hypothetical protein PLM14_16675 [Candidatus Hydrogenedentes bacterium]|nr:hypothetical protein [Candidatus Hydrogenedentota bacterium]